MNQQYCKINHIICIVFFDILIYDTIVYASVTKMFLKVVGFQIFLENLNSFRFTDH